VRAAKALNVPSFIVVEKTGAVLRYTSGDRLDRLSGFQFADSGGIARGTVVHPGGATS